MLGSSIAFGSSRLSGRTADYVIASSDYTGPAQYDYKALGYSTLTATLSGATLTSPSSIASGSTTGTTVTVSGTGNITVTLGAGQTGLAISRTSAVTGSPLALVAGVNTVPCTGAGTFTITGMGDETYINTCVAAIKAAYTNGHKIRLVGNTFKIFNTITIDVPGLTIEGDNPGTGSTPKATCIYQPNGCDLPKMIYVNGDDILMKNMEVFGNDSNNAYALDGIVYNTGLNDCGLDKCEIFYCKRYGAVAEQDQAFQITGINYEYNGYGFDMTSSYNFKVINCFFGAQSNAGDGSGVIMGSAYKMIFTNSGFSGNTHDAFESNGANHHIAFLNCYFQGNGAGSSGTDRTISLLSDDYDFTFTGCLFYLNNTWSIYGTLVRTIVSGCHFYNNGARTNNTYPDIKMLTGSTGSTIIGNTFYAGGANKVSYYIQEDSGASGNTFQGNTFTSGAVSGMVSATYLSTWSNNPGYIAPGEVRTYTGIVTSAADHHGAIISSVDNPFGQAVKLTKVSLAITTQAGAAATLDVGLSAANNDDPATKLFTALPLNPGTTYPYLYNSLSNGLGGTAQGTQTDDVYWNTGTGTRYLNFYNPSASSDNAAVWTYTVTVVG